MHPYQILHARADSFNGARVGKKRGPRAKWPHVIPSSDKMAEAGFYFAPLHSKMDDNVKCFFCDVEISEWTQDDDPVLEHLRYNPQCAWARVQSGKHNVDDRLATFAHWPHCSTNWRPNPLCLAQAGFFFNPESRRDDTVECAYCETCLSKWEPNDDPLLVHREVNPDCVHVCELYETSSLFYNQICEAPDTSMSGISSQTPSTRTSMSTQELVSPQSPVVSSEHSMLSNPENSASVEDVSGCDQAEDLNEPPDLHHPLASQPQASIQESHCGPRKSHDLAYPLPRLSASSESGMQTALETQTSLLPESKPAAIGRPSKNHSDRFSTSLLDISSSRESVIPPEERDPETPEYLNKQEPSLKEPRSVYPSPSKFSQILHSTPAIFRSMSPHKLLATVAPSPVPAAECASVKATVPDIPRNQEVFKVPKHPNKFPVMPQFEECEEACKSSTEDPDATIPLKGLAASIREHTSPSTTGDSIEKVFEVTPPCDWSSSINNMKGSTLGLNNGSRMSIFAPRSSFNGPNGAPTELGSRRGSFETVFQDIQPVENDDQSGNEISLKNLDANSSVKDTSATEPAYCEKQRSSQIEQADQTRLDENHNGAPTSSAKPSEQKAAETRAFTDCEVVPLRIMESSKQSRNASPIKITLKVSDQHVPPKVSSMKLNLDAKERLIREMSSQLPPSRVEYLMTRRDLPTKQWIALLAKEVSAFIIENGEIAVQILEEQRVKALDAVRQQYTV